MKNYAEQITKAKSFYLLLAALEIALCFVIIKKVSCELFYSIHQRCFILV